MVTADQIRKARNDRRFKPTDHKHRMKVTLAKNRSEFDMDNYITDHSIPIKSRDDIINTESDVHYIEPISQPKRSKKDDGNIYKDHPSSIMTSEAYKIVNSKKHVFMAMLKCGHCNTQKKFVDGNLRVPIYDPQTKKLMYGFEDHKKSNKMVKQAVKDLKRDYKNKKIKKKDYNKMLEDIYHISEVNKSMIKLGFEQVKDNYMYINVDDLTEEDIAPYREEMDNFNDAMIKINKERNRMEKLYGKGKVSDTQFKQFMKSTHQQKLQVRENLINKLKKEEKGIKLARSLVVDEIVDIYGIGSYPSFIHDSCSIPQDPNVNVGELAEMGYTDGILKGCVSAGTKTELQFIDYDAQQRNDKETIHEIVRTQKQMARSKNKKKSIDQLVAET
jgi:hypothetical protein